MDALPRGVAEADGVPRSSAAADASSSPGRLIGAGVLPMASAAFQLVGHTTAELEALMAQLGEPPYRGRQLAEWIYRRYAEDFAPMTDLPRTLRARLSAQGAVGLPRVAATNTGEDGTTKYLVRLGDGNAVECVWLPYRRWSSVCLSSQVGCPVGCSFCATGQMGFYRNLTPGEMVGQFLVARRRSPVPITRAVFMGMGEPLLNYRNVLRAVHLLHDECGLGARHLTISTVGVVPGIRRLAREPLPVNLALSLHAPDDDLRATLIPLARRYPLAEVMAAVREYVEATHRKVTLEYLLLAGVNDSVEHAGQLARLIHWEAEGRGLLAGVNVIPYNETGARFRRPSEARIGRFMERLRSLGVSATRRLERGHEIAAACGQLANRAGAVQDLGQTGDTGA
ncbi:MAG: 23S rRNA (adenine(2503)-C(2))-methyltransferase RlmN [Armatimonadota bacterium]|nr:23S rRNA (adenine(2503)-C(2))-methyltransferase RlmN [Armatimonadota bacterium]